MNKKDKELDAAIQNLDQKLGQNLSQETSQRKEQDGELEKLVNDTKNKLEETDTKNRAELEAELNNLKNSLEAKITEVQDQLTAYMTTTDKNIADLRNDITKNKNALETAKTEIAATIAAIENNLTNKIKDTKDELDRDIQSLAGKLTQAQNAIRNLETEAANLKNRADGADQTINLLDQWAHSETSKIKGDVNSLRNKDTQHDQKISALETTASDLESDLQSLENDYTSFLADHGNEMNQIREDIGTQNKTIQAIQANLTAIWMELAKKAGYWTSLNELTAWLEQDTTDNNTWTERTYDCDDFATDLAKNALEYNRLVYPIVVSTRLWYTTDPYYSGYWLIKKDYVNWIYFEDEEGQYRNWMIGNHMIDLTYVEQLSTGWVFIDPQTDAIYITGVHEL